jgi:hypothetical protein
MGGYNLTYDRSKDPYGKQFDISQLGSMVGNVAGNYFGNGMWGNIGSQIGGQAGQQMEGAVYGPTSAMLQDTQQGNPQLPKGEPGVYKTKQTEDINKKQDEEEKLKKLLALLALRNSLSTTAVFNPIGGMYGR